VGSLEIPSSERDRYGGGGNKAKDAPERGLTLVEKLFRTAILDREEYSAAGQMRNLHLLLQPPPEGVPSYGQSTGRADLTRRKANKTDESTTRLPSQNKRAIERRYSDALFAMCGVIDDEGRKVADPHIVVFMLRAITDSKTIPNQTEIGRTCAIYVKENRPSKQVSALGSFYVKVYLRRLAMHFRATSCRGDA
jgi:hypothetical protein